MAGRQEKIRQVQTLPEFITFSPDGIPSGETVTLSIDEFETLRLIDLEGMNQTDACKKINVARTTVTAIYDRARTKVADAIVNGKELKIEGGNFQFSPRNIRCRKIKSKGAKAMRIAVTYENGQVFQHFGKTGQFKFYDVEDKKITSSRVSGTNGAGHGALAGFLKDNNVDVLICGGIGGGAQKAMAEAKIKFYGGVNGSADEAVQKLLDGNLEYNPNVVCSHHHEGGSHNCGGNHEGGHSCNHNCGHN